MPAIIDHDARRATLAEVAADLIAAEGLEAATVRRLAVAAGFSTKVVSHYFTDKRALLLMTYRFAADDSARRAERTRPVEGADARAHVLSLLPLEPVMLRNWKVWFAFWGFAISDDEFAGEQRRQVVRARMQLSEALVRDHAFRRLDEPARERAARELITLVIGIALQATFDPDDWPAARQAQPILDRMDNLSRAHT
jgi:AcrR family transcriptional regulator